MELVRYNENSDQVVVSSKDVAEHFEKRHDNVVRDIEGFKDLLNFEEMFLEDSYQDTYSRNQKCYLMNRDGFSLLAMGFTGQKALEWKLKYIAAFNAMEKEFNSPERIMARALQIANRELTRLKIKNQALLEDNETMKPKAVFADAVATSKSTIQVGELAKILRGNGIDIGQQRLFGWLRENGFLIKRKGSDWNMPTQYAMEMGLFKIKETAASHSDGHVTISKTPKVTGKGQEYFVNRFLSGTSSPETVSEAVN